MVRLQHLEALPGDAGVFIHAGFRRQIAVALAETAVVDGSVVLIGGDPGIGKSTILLQTLCQMATRMPALYVTGEESQQQVAMRARRLGLPQDQLKVMTETCIESIIATAKLEKPKVMVIDSIQTIFTEQLQSAPGGVSQVRESAALLVRYAKSSGTAIFLVGHVTKEGALAGAAQLEAAGA